MLRWTEVEFKYKADNVSLTAFIAFCEGKKPEKVVLASGYDHFYEHETDANRSCRHRVGADSNQLTFKRKTVDENNYVRTERNTDLTREMTKDDIAGLVSEFGYKYNNSIFKNCFIYCYEWYTLVYYVVYDTEMQETGRFVEIEMKETNSWLSKEQAWNELLLLEKLCKDIGAAPRARVKPSLFELYRKKAA